MDYDSTTAPKDIVEMTDFMKELHDIPVPDVEKIRSDNGFINWTKFEFLHEVEENTEMVTVTFFAVSLMRVKLLKYKFETTTIVLFSQTFFVQVIVI